MTEGRVFALFGHPVAHSLSPVIHTAAYESLGLSHKYQLCDLLTRADLARAMDEIRAGVFAGANVTIPHKRAALELADEVDPSAELPGVANVLHRADSGRIRAHNTDADALADDIASVLPDSPRSQAVVIGGGGAGFAAIVACRRLGFQKIAVTSRSWSSPEYLATSPVLARMQALGALVFPWPSNESSGPSRPQAPHFHPNLPADFSEFVRSSTLIVQATSAGMSGADPGDVVATIVPWGDLSDHTLAYDVVYNPPVTPFLRAATTHRLLARGGLGMLVRQAARSIELWTGQSPPLDILHRAAEQTLARRGQTE
jgi:shikimate dehydrogenase